MEPDGVRRRNSLLRLALTPMTVRDFLGVGYEGLPFVPPKRLFNLLQRVEQHLEAKESAEVHDEQQHRLRLRVPIWEPQRRTRTRDFLQDYFKVQELVYHSLLEMIFEVSTHLEYWLDWTMPVRRRPEWLWAIARHFCAVSVGFSGRADQVAAPDEIVQQLRDLHSTLARLVAQTQLNSFQVLSWCTEEEEDDLTDLSDALESCMAQQLNELECLVQQRHAAQSRWSSAGISNGLTAQFCPEIPRQDLALPPAGELTWPLGRTDERSNGSTSHGIRMARSHSEPISRSTPADQAPDDGAAASDEVTPRDESPREGPSLRGKAYSVFNTISHAFSGNEPAFDDDASVQWLPARQKQLKDLHDGLSDAGRRLHQHIGRVGCPSHFAFYAPVYNLGALLMFGFACTKLKTSESRHDIFERVTGAATAFLREWIVEPYGIFFENLTNHVRQEKVLKIQLDQLKDHEAQMDRMLDEFSNAVKKDPNCPVDFSKEYPENQYWEKSMQNPIYNMTNGHLMECCMIQSQRMKVWMMASMFSVDTVIAQLKWDFLMAGIMPMFCLCGIGYWILTSRGRRRLFQQRRSMLRALGDVDKFFIRLSEPEGEHVAADGSPSHRESTWRPSFSEQARDNPIAMGHCFSMTPEESRLDELQRNGESLIYLDTLYRSAYLFHGLDGSDWRSFRRDILDLASPKFSPMQKLRLISMMRSTYPIFQG